MKHFWLFLVFCITLLAQTVSLQQVIDRAAAGSKIVLPEGRYRGNIVIRKPLLLVGQKGKTTIKGEGNGTVITVTAPYVTLQNLTIVQSGTRTDRIDAAIRFSNTSHGTILNCTIRKVLYGIVFDNVRKSRIEGCHIRSRPEPIPQRGDAIKLWYSSHNTIIDNRIAHARDVALLFSHYNRIGHNRFHNNRMALHLENSHHNTLFDNTFAYNEVGMLIMGAKDTNVTRNRIESSQGVAGIGVVADKVSGFLFKDNLLKYNTKALYIDAKRTEKGYQRTIRDNALLYNYEALHFHADIAHNIIEHNLFKDNLEDVTRDVKGSRTYHNRIEKNYWGYYEGFDRNKDGIGDTPYRKYLYADRLWLFDNKLKFFYATPIMTLVDFLVRLAPFSQPLLLLEDPKPLMVIPTLPALSLPR
jgi:nitrous oxidase accessory protein